MRHTLRFLPMDPGYYGTRYGRPAYRHDSVVDNTDPRIDLLQASWFEGKKCLDVGCNEGHFTLALVRRFRPRQMVGIDIDCFLVQKARQVIASLYTWRCMQDILLWTGMSDGEFRDIQSRPYEQ